MNKTSSQTKNHNEVWILEDDPMCRQMTSEVARTLGASPLLLGSLEEALGLWQQVQEGKHPTPQAIVSDLQLADGFSLEFLITIKLCSPNIPVCCISGSLTCAIMEQLNLHHIASWEKPCDLRRALTLVIKPPS